MSRRYDRKGLPSFAALDNDRLRTAQEVINVLARAYDGIDPNAATFFSKAWRDISEELVFRTSEEPVRVAPRVPTDHATSTAPKPKPAASLVRGPIRKKNAR